MSEKPAFFDEDCYLILLSNLAEWRPPCGHKTPGLSGLIDLGLNKKLTSKRGCTGHITWFLRWLGILVKSEQIVLQKTKIAKKPLRMAFLATSAAVFILSQTTCWCTIMFLHVESYRSHWACSLYTTRGVCLEVRFAEPAVEYRRPTWITGGPFWPWMNQPILFPLQK